jgi:UDP-N-acetylmuramyl pentapeptide phosphotransferase/UDP-N-acetylglucosamine-1-phosphate transferase
LIVRSLAPVIAFALSLLLLRGLQSSVVRAWFLDHPNPRSLHVTPVPRTGGLGMVPAALAGILLAGGDVLLVGLCSGLMLLSALDDWRSVPSSVRLLAHLSASAALVIGTAASAGWVQGAALAVAVAWMINLYNFMDGADGLAGGMTVFGFSAYACAAWLAGDAALATACLSVAAAAAAFLVFNFPPARIFMGDAGSVPLGFLAAGLGLAGWRGGHWPWWFPLVVFAPFVADATVTLGRRAVCGERFWEAHRSHYYQRQVLMGWSHRRLALTEYALMGVTVAAALGALRSSVRAQALIFVVLALLYLGTALAVDVRWRVRQEA